jgi:endonuclease YncB( thermonuclease family)
MTSTTAVAEQEARPAYPLRDGPDRAALRDALRLEVARARPFPVAERTLTLIAQAALEPQPEPPGYRVIDRHGAPRFHEAVEGGQPRPFTLADLMDELRARHPALFLPPEPKPEPDPTPETRDSPLAASASEMRAATARFFGSQTVRARSLAEQSSVQGRALAQQAAGTFATLRGRLRRERAPATEATSWEAGRGRFGEALATLRGSFAGADDAEGHRTRFWLAGAATLTVAMVAAAVFINAPGTPERPSSDSPSTGVPAARPSPAPTATAEPAPTARAPSVPDNVTPPPEGDGRGDAETDAPPPAPNAITGPVQVIDTATLKLNGKLVHLFGVEWVRGGQAQELTRYIAGRAVTCQPAPGSESMNCNVDGRDLSEVILYNGGGRASPEASPELVAAEDHARSERLGVWRR